MSPSKSKKQLVGPAATVAADSDVMVEGFYQALNSEHTESRVRGQIGGEVIDIVVTTIQIVGEAD